MPHQFAIEAFVRNGNGISQIFCHVAPTVGNDHGSGSCTVYAGTTLTAEQVASALTGAA